MLLQLRFFGCSNHALKSFQIYGFLNHKFNCNFEFPAFLIFLKITKILLKVFFNVYITGTIGTLKVLLQFNEVFYMRIKYASKCLITNSLITTINVLYSQWHVRIFNLILGLVTLLLLSDTDPVLGTDFKVKIQAGSIKRQCVQLTLHLQLAISNVTMINIYLIYI